nr:hypothetical protein [Paracoccus saliphilus]
MTIIDAAITKHLSLAGDVIDSGDSNRKVGVMLIERILAGLPRQLSCPHTQPVAVAA